MPTRNEIPEGMAAIHSTNFADIEEARGALGGLAPTREAIAGEAPWPKQPTTLLVTPRLVAAWSYCALAKARGAKVQETPPPTSAPTPAASIDPTTIRDFNDLLSRGLEAVTRFEREHPADYAKLRTDRNLALAHPTHSRITPG